MSKGKPRPVRQTINFQEHPNVAKHDWRLHAATTITKEATINGTVFPVGSVVKASSQIRLSKKGEILNLGAPNVPAMLLNLADQFDLRATTLHQDVLTLAKSGKSEASDDTQLFDALEARMGAAVFAYTALEAFANEVIENAYGKGFRYAPTLRSGLTVSYDLESIERKLSLEEKIASVIPAALAVNSPKGRTPYNRFKRLKDLRDRIIHLKGRDRIYSNDKTFWRELMSAKSADFAIQAYDIIAFFFNQIPGEVPRWFAKFGMSKGRL
jgi:hypothetical protein